MALFAAMLVALLLFLMNPAAWPLPVLAAAAGAAVGRHADTAGMHRLAWVMLGAGAVYLLVTVLDRSPLRPASTPGAVPE